MAHSLTPSVAQPAASEEKASRRHFDRWTGLYSRSRLLAVLQDKALSELDPRDDDRLLDVACGSGKLVRAAAPHVDRVVGVDLSPGMIDEARRQSKAAGLEGSVEFVVSPSGRLPFRDEAFTAVVTTTAFHHFPDPAGSVREMARVLAPGGRLLIGDAVRETPPALIADIIMRRVEGGHVGLQNRPSLEHLLRGHGLQVVRSRAIWLGLYAFVMGKKPNSAEPAALQDVRAG